MTAVTRPTTRRASPADFAVAAARHDALTLAAAVRAHDVDLAHKVLDRHATSTRATQALAVALASLVPESATSDDVLAYCPQVVRDRFADDPTLWSSLELRSLHSAFGRRERAPKVLAGEREYQRRRHIRRKYLRDVTAQAASVHDEAGS